QDKTAGLLRRTEEAILSAMDAIAEAKQGGTEEKSLGEAMNLHRSAQLRWDFISSENSTGFQSPQEAARVLAEGIDMARRAELSAYARKARR
ncbi:ammonia-forming cytochrome c nitrite reductase subunit c552, partial [bacterium]|nr:ammonia-forming cytochrome c nitrite reductase subunit c552 [bacterium]